MEEILQAIRDELDRGSEKNRPFLLVMEAAVHYVIESERKPGGM